MKKQGMIGRTVGALVGLAMSTSAAAIPEMSSSEFIDFRDWSGANGQQSYSVGNVTAKALTNNDREGSVLYQDSDDGLGIMGSACGYEKDEIDSCERLRVDFSWSPAFDYFVTGVWISDLFAPNDGSNANKGEVGRVQIWMGGNKSVTSVFGINSDQGNGEQYVDFGGQFKIERVQFWANRNDGNEFSVAGFTIVPEPATLALMGIGLMGVGAMRRKKS